MEHSGGEIKIKRKYSPVPTMESRPAKQQRRGEAGLINSSSPPHNSSVMEITKDNQRTPVPAAVLDSVEWQNTIAKVVKSVVSIHFCQTCSFDTDGAMTSQATGFVVDAKKGYILTNRHVACAGPFWGYCIFDNHEECDVYPIYRDPVHDFGILKFDPKAIRYMEIKALELKPQNAEVGAAIRVVGNDAGEKLSILSGVISRLDRNAPEYGDGYCDFNINYIQAAAAASGGSSGSPVVTIDGCAVALQAGGRADGAATDFFLPLDRPLRALKALQSGESVTRGTIQTQWLLKAFDECRRLGLTPDREEVVRKEKPEETSMLVAEIVLPEGPADGKIEEGDVLLEVNGELLTQFTRLDAILDSSVGKKVELLIERGGQNLKVELEVGDLHAITPDRFVTHSGGTFHNISYQQARLYAIAVKGVYVCEAAGSWRQESSMHGWIIQTVDKYPTPNLQAFIDVVKNIPDRARIAVTYRHIRDLHNLNTRIIRVDRHWNSKMRLAVRNDKTGLWDYTTLAESIPAIPPKPREADFIQLESTVLPPGACDIVRSFVRVSCDMPVKLDGFPVGHKTGYGLVVNAEMGLILVSRFIVPFDLCDILVTIAESIIVEAKILFLHPLQNYAIIQYDPSLVKAPIKTPVLSPTPIKLGQETIFFGFNNNWKPTAAKTSVTDITTVNIPANSSAPRYRAINLDAIAVETPVASSCGNGVLMSSDGTVRAVWLNYLGDRSPGNHKDVEYYLGLGTPGIIPVVDSISKGITPKLRMLNIEAYTIPMAEVRVMGVSEDWIRRVTQTNPHRHQLFIIRKVDCSSLTSPKIPAAQTLREGDIILTLNGKLITRVSELDIMYNNEYLDALIVRDGNEMKLRVKTVETQDLVTDRVVMFCGAVIQRPHHAVRQQISRLHSEVYVSARSRGSPAYQYGLIPTHFITAINGHLTPDLTSFIATVNTIPDNTYFRVKVVTFDNVPWVITMKKNEHYFPTVEYFKVDGNEEVNMGGVEDVAATTPDMRDGAIDGDIDKEAASGGDVINGWKRIVHRRKRGMGDDDDEGVDGNGDGAPSADTMDEGSEGGGSDDDGEGEDWVGGWVGGTN
ncbi:MAG: hypothetical protein M1834_000842 [Cirrosporium novae-zelandiae]|nr:MAG: hypothetical protein M1834_000842 [Cirrosporium novae-zelandiae]